MKTIFAIYFGLMATACGQRYINLNNTNRVTSTNLIAVEMFPNATNGTKSISISNLAISLGPYITNSGSGGGGGSLVTNANQFAASTTLTIKSGALVTNAQLYGTTTGNGLIDAAAGLQIPTLTGSRAAIINGATDITNSTVTSTELGYVSGVTSALQTQINNQSTNFVDLRRTLWVATNGSDATALRGSLSFPYGSLSNAMASAVSGDTIIVLPGIHTIYGLSYTLLNQSKNAYTKAQGLHNITLMGLGRGSQIYQSTRGAGVVFSMCTNVLVKDLTFKSFHTNGVFSLAQNGLPMGLGFWGTNRNAVVENCVFDTHEGSAIHATSGDSTDLIRVNVLTVRNCEFYSCGWTNWSGISPTSTEGGLVQAWNNLTFINNVSLNASRGIEQYTETAGEVIVGARIEGNRFVNTWGYDLFQVDGRSHRDVRIANNFFSKSWDRYFTADPPFIFATAGENWHISGNTFSNATASAIDLDAQNSGFTNVFVVNNIFTGVDEYGIAMINGAALRKNILIKDNLFDSIGRSPIYVTGTDVAVQNNFLKNWGTNAAGGGVRVQGALSAATNVVINGNVFSDANDVAIVFESTTYSNKVFGNTILNASSPVTDSGTGSLKWFNPTTNGLNGQLLTENGSGALYWSTVSGAGEANVNGEIAVTNSSRIGLVHGKDGITNNLRAIQGGVNVSLTNHGTNILIAVPAGGAHSYIQWNSNGVLAGSTFFRFDPAVDGLTLGSSMIVTSSVVVHSSVQAGRVDATNTLRLLERDGGLDSIAIQAPVTMSSNISYTLPGTNGINGQVLTANAGGVLSWDTPAAGSGGPTTSNNIPSGVTIFGTAPATNILVDASLGTVFRVVLTNSMGIIITNGSDAQDISLELYQDATGNRSVVLLSNASGSVTNQVAFGTDITSPITLTTNALKMDTFKARFVKEFGGATNRWNVIGFVRGYAQ